MIVWLSVCFNKQKQMFKKKKLRIGSKGEKSDVTLENVFFKNVFILNLK